MTPDFGFRASLAIQPVGCWQPKHDFEGLFFFCTFRGSKKKTNLEFLITFWHFSIGFLTTGKHNGFPGTLPWPDEDKALGMFGSEGWANDHYIYESIFDDMDWDGDVWNHEKYFWDQYCLGWDNKKATKSIAVSTTNAVWFSRSTVRGSTLTSEIASVVMGFYQVVSLPWSHSSDLD